MFLLRSFRYSKWLFLLFVSVLALHLFINFKRGLTIIPIVHYGMYSGPYKRADTVVVWQIELNGKVLPISSLHPVQADRLLDPLQHYPNINQANEALYQNSIRPVLQKTGLPVWDEAFRTRVTDGQFKTWYCNLVGRMTGTPVRELKVSARTTAVDGARYKTVHQHVFLHVQP